MKNMQEHLAKRLQIALKPTHLEVINESHQHSGPATDSHFKLVVVSDYFNNVKLIDRHRFINKLFATELSHIHALAMHVYTSYEWSFRNKKAPVSPKCAK